MHCPYYSCLSISLSSKGLNLKTSNKPRVVNLPQKLQLQAQVSTGLLIQSLCLETDWRTLRDKNSILSKISFQWPLELFCQSKLTKSRSENDMDKKSILNRLQSKLEFPMLWTRRNGVGSLLLRMISQTAFNADDLVASLCLKGLLFIVTM